MAHDRLPRVWVHLDPGAARDILAGRAELIGPGVDPALSVWDGIESADAALLSTTRSIGRSTFESASRLKVISRFGTGTDNVDVAAATELGICVTNNPDVVTRAVAEFTLGLMFALARRVTEADRAVRKGGWEDGRSLIGFELGGKTLGVVGAGRIGGKVLSLASAIGMRALAYDSLAVPEQRERLAAAGVEMVESLEELAAVVDVLSLHTPATSQTSGLVSAGVFARMKPGALLINVARGSVIDELALLDALDSGRIAGAALDVLQQEPPDPNHPLLGRPDVIVTPHIAGGSQEVIVRSRQSAAEQALAVLDGVRPPFLVDPSVWEKRR